MSGKRCYSSYSKKIKQSWQKEEQFRNWLKKSPKSTAAKDVAFCSICGVDITCGKSELVRHSKSQRHRKLAQQHASLQSMTTYVLSNDPVDRSARKFELMMCAFLSEHYLPISLSESLFDLFKTLFSCIDNEGLKRVSLGKQRTSNIIRPVFGKHFSDELCTSLRERLFSVIIDETTDRSTTKQLCILVQYFDENSLRSSFLDLIEVHSSTAQGIFAAIKQCFSFKNIPMQNIIAFCSDTNVMMGSKQSVATLLKAEVPNVIIVKCSCHLIHLTASYACLRLPKYIEDLCRNIYSHFSLSSKRQDALKEFQKFADLEPQDFSTWANTLAINRCV